VAAMLAFLQTNSVSLGSSYFSEYWKQFEPVSGDVVDVPNLGQLVSTNQQFLTVDLKQTIWPVYDWTLTVSNQIMYALLDANTGAVYDFVNIGPFGQSVQLTNLIFNGPTQPFIQTSSLASAGVQANYWDPTSVGVNLPSRGVMNQITNGMAGDGYFAAELRGITATQNSAYFTNSGNSNLYFSCSNDLPANVITGTYNLLLANDPLVHYTLGDLTPPAGLGTNVMSGVLTPNTRYEPWPNNNDYYQQTIRDNMTFKDPLIFSPDDWSFPTNQFPSVGWLGRVHRGTPWQTIFLKADGNPAANGNPYNWVNKWVSTLDTYPTTDYGLLDLFTAAPNDNAARGQLSVNQTNDAPWYAVFSGLVVPTNVPSDSLLFPSISQAGPSGYTIVDPANVALLTQGYLSGTNLVPGINIARAAQPDQVFHNTGSIFSAPTLSIDSPFLPAPANYFTDEEVEAIPQQIAGLIKLGQPRFVVYSWGQALKPKDIYFGSQTNLFNLCTNYQITGEYLTRTVCHVVGNPVTGNLKLQVDAFNILPAD
jgi:hypothetical protein